jgi:hypothetical protein
MTNKTLFAIAINATPIQQELLIKDLALSTSSADWTVSKGLDGITILLGTVAATAIASITKILIKYLEERGDILVEIVIDKKKYKFQGLDQQSISSILQSLRDNKNDS